MRLRVDVTKPEYWASSSPLSTSGSAWPRRVCTTLKQEVCMTSLVRRHSLWGDCLFRLHFAELSVFAEDCRVRHRTSLLPCSETSATESWGCRYVAVQFGNYLEHLRSRYNKHEQLLPTSVDLTCFCSSRCRQRYGLTDRCRNNEVQLTSFFDLTF